MAQVRNPFEEFMKLEKVTDPGNWISQKLSSNKDLVFFNANKPISEQIEINKGKTLLIVKSAKQTCFYELMEEMNKYSEDFKIYRIEQNEFYAVEVRL